MAIVRVIGGRLNKRTADTLMPKSPVNPGRLKNDRLRSLAG